MLQDNTVDTEFLERMRQAVGRCPRLFRDLLKLESFDGLTTAEIVFRAFMALLSLRREQPDLTIEIKEINDIIQAYATWFQGLVPYPVAGRNKDMIAADALDAIIRATMQDKMNRLMITPSEPVFEFGR